MSDPFDREGMQRLREKMDSYLRSFDPPAPPARRSRVLANPRDTWDKAVRDLKDRDTRLTKTAVATEMGITRETLNTYIDDKLIPAFPWEDALPRR